MNQAECRFTSAPPPCESGQGATRPGRGAQPSSEETESARTATAQIPASRSVCPGNGCRSGSRTRGGETAVTSQSLPEGQFSSLWVHLPRNLTKRKRNAIRPHGWGTAQAAQRKREQGRLGERAARRAPWPLAPLQACCTAFLAPISISLN